MTRISDLNRNQDLTDGDLFPIGAEDGSTRGVAAKDAAKYFTSEIEPIVDEAKQAALEAQQTADAETVIKAYGENIASWVTFQPVIAHSGRLYSYVEVGAAICHVKQGE